MIVHVEVSTNTSIRLTSTRKEKISIFMTINSTKVLGGLIALVGAFTFATSSASADEVPYTVQSGDTVSQIAVDNNTSIDELETANQIDQNTHLIYVGQTLNLQSTTPVTNDTSSQATEQPVTTVSTPVVEEQVTTTTTDVATTTTVSASGSTYEQFIQAGGTDAMWNSIVLPESSGNPSASNGRYHGLGQTDQAWGYGDVATQTQGLINYMTSRYGNEANALAFRNANGYW